MGGNEDLTALLRSLCGQQQRLLLSIELNTDDRK